MLFLSAALVTVISVNHGIRKIRGKILQKRSQKLNKNGNTIKTSKNETKKSLKTSVANEEKQFVPQLTAKSLEQSFSGDYYLVPVVSQPLKTSKKNKKHLSTTGIRANYSWTSHELKTILVGPNTKDYFTIFNTSSLYLLIDVIIKQIKEHKISKVSYSTSNFLVLLTEEDLKHSNKNPIFSLDIKQDTLHCCLFQESKLTSNFKSLTKVLDDANKREQNKGFEIMQKYSRTPRDNLNKERGYSKYDDQYYTSSYEETIVSDGLSNIFASDSESSNILDHFYSGDSIYSNDETEADFEETLEADIDYDEISSQKSYCNISSVDSTSKSDSESNYMASVASKNESSGIISSSLVSCEKLDTDSFMGKESSKKSKTNFSKTLKLSSQKKTYFKKTNKKY